MDSHWNLSDSKSSQVSRTLQRTLADLKEAVFWMVSTRPLISKSSCPSTSPLVTVPSAPITIDITVPFIFQIFFNSQASFSSSFSFTRWSAGTAKPTIRQVLLLLVLLLFTPLEFLTSVLADGFSLEFEWQQVSSSLQNSSQYSGRSH